MAKVDRKDLWNSFLATWPADRVREMTLEEYTNPDKENAFIYWIESKLEKLGSIWGGSAFKFGIYHRDDTGRKQPSRGRIWGDKYAWLAKFGQTPDEAFASVHARLVEVIECSRSGNFERVDEIDLSPTLKWKVAFLYQDQNHPSVFPIFKSEALFHHYQKLDPTAKRSSTPQSLMYATLIERDGQIADPIDIASELWSEWNKEKPATVRAWAIPIGWLGPEIVSSLCSKDRIEPEDIDDFLERMLANAEMSEGDQLALLEGGSIRALGTLTCAEPSQFSWTQVPTDFPSGLLVNPTDIKELNASERKRIWRQAPDLATFDKSPKTSSKKETSPLPPSQPQNVLLYGPPGTGKTYSTIRRALELVLGKDKVVALSDKNVWSLFRDHQARGQIEFVTFHQAYGYEEFVEGLRPVLNETDAKDVQYELHDGVFKRIAFRAAAEGLADTLDSVDFDELWDRLTNELQRESEKVAQGQSGKHYVLRLSSHGNIAAYQSEVDDEGNVVTITDKRQLASKDKSKILWEQRNSFGIMPENLTYQKALDIFGVGNHYTALWIVYSQLLGLSRGARPHTEVRGDKTFRVQQALDKPTPGRASFEFSAQSRQYVIIIDEINRGNISKILGELITLLDPDKRLGAQNELKLPLSYSPNHRFAVPPNLHVLGTMNTADRSIALMDVALRRRFTFEELMPDSVVVRNELLRKSIEPALTDLIVELFETINRRLRFIYDRDHQLEHSYFLNVATLDNLREVFVNRVIPLLQEYFYGDWQKICTVLGCPYNEQAIPRRAGFVIAKGGGPRRYEFPLVEVQTFSDAPDLGFERDDYEDRFDFRIERRFQSGVLSDRELAKAFLGVLQLDDQIMVERLELLVSNGQTVKPKNSDVEPDSNASTVGMRR